MPSRDYSGIIQAVFLFGGGFAGVIWADWLDAGPWTAMLVIAVGTFSGMAAHAGWERRPGGRKVRPERLKDIETAIRTYRAGTEHSGDERRWAAAVALERLAAHTREPAGRERIAAFVRVELEKEARKQTSPHYVNQDVRRLLQILARANPAWQVPYLESLQDTPAGILIRERLAELRRLPISSADRQYVRDALVRFEEAGLKIKAHLDREAIVLRALLDAGSWRYDGDDPAEAGKALPPAVLASLFVALAGEIDILPCGEEDVSDWEPDPIPAMQAEALKIPNFAEEYSRSIFTNAATIGVTNEGDGLKSGIQEIVELSRGAISLACEVASNSWEVKIVSNGTVRTCLIDGRKRPDLTPFFEILDDAAREQGYTYLCPDLGNSSEYELIACIALNKLDTLAAFTKPLNP
jgi:hypothetical protein